jgi:hypothetical protein
LSSQACKAVAGCAIGRNTASFDDHRAARSLYIGLSIDGQVVQMA